MSLLSLRNLRGGATRSNNPEGIDVTADANGNFDWHAWTGHIQFGSAMATRGTDYADPEFINNWDTMSQLELVRFAFHWFDDNADPGQQAVHFYETVHEGGLTEYDGLVLYIDQSIGRDIVDAGFAAYVFCQEIEALSGHRPVIMATSHIVETGWCAKLGEYPLWVIDYDTPVPHVHGPWSEWTFWQYSANMVGRNRFNGNMKQLDRI